MFKLRNARVSDVSTIHAWNANGVSSPLGLDSATVKDLITSYPEGQFVAEFDDGNIGGILHSIRLASLSTLSQCVFETQFEHHDPFGAISLITAINGKSLIYLQQQKC